METRLNKSCSIPEAIGHRRLAAVKIFLPVFLMILTLSCKVVADPAAFADYQAIPDLESKLQKTWTKQQYINAYLHPDVLAMVEEFVAKAERRKEPLGRFNFFWLEGMAALYAETGNSSCLDLVKRGLVHETTYPSTRDIQFSLSIITHCYELVRTDLDAVLTAGERSSIESRIAAHAHTCLTMEAGTEMNRGIMNMLGLIRSAELYPNQAEASLWMSTAVYNWENGFKRMKDNNEDSTSYNALWLYNMMMVAERLETNLPAFYQQPWVRDNFERFLNVRLPLGVEPLTFNHYTFVENNPAIYEWAGKIYQDGRYRWAAQRMFNFRRAQIDRSTDVPYEPVFIYTDDSVQPVAPQGSSYYSHRRYDREYPNKFVLRNGYGPNATALFMNLFQGGGHGLADGSSIYSLMDQYGWLLAEPARDECSEEYSNLVLFRKSTDPFPFGPTAPGEWRRAHVGLLAGNTALGGLNNDLSAIIQTGIRFDAANTASGNVWIRNVSVGGGRGSTVLSSAETKFSVAEKWMNFPATYPLNLSGDEYLEFEWKYDAASAPINPNVYISSSNPSASVRYYSFLFHNWRNSKVRFYGDYAAVHMASVEVDLYGYDGGNHRQYRDVILLPNELIWVRDTFVFGSSGDFQVGPLWHVGDVKSSENSWFQTRSYTTSKYKKSWVEAGAPRDLLIVMPERSGFTNSKVTASSLSDRPCTLYQKWSGVAQAGQRIAFNSFLLPNSNTPDLKEAAGKVQLMQENDSVAVARFGEWMLVDNPEGKTVRAGLLETDYSLLAVQFGSGNEVISCSGLGGKRFSYDGVELKVQDIK